MENENKSNKQIELTAYDKYLDDVANRVLKGEDKFGSDLNLLESELKSEFEKYIRKIDNNLKKKIKKETDPFKRQRLQDAYNNNELMLGESEAFAGTDEYVITSLIYDWQKWTALFISSWIFNKAITRISSDMVGSGWAIIPVAKNESFLLKKNKLVKKKKIEEFDLSPVYSDMQESLNDLITLVQWGKLYGGSIAVLLRDDEKIEEYKNELTPFKQGTKIKLLVFDRWQQVASSNDLVGDVGSPDFGDPTYYTVIMPGAGNVQFHHTRVLRFTNIKAPNILNPLLLGWGLPAGVIVLNEINRDERIRAMITALIGKFNLEIIKSSGIRAYMNGQMSATQEANLDRKLSLINKYRISNTTLIMDKDDVYERHDGANIAGLYQLIQEEARYVTGAFDMPQVLMFGDQQKGLSGNVNDDLRLYENKLESDRNQLLRKVALKFTKWLMILHGFNDVDFNIEFNSSLSLSLKEKLDEASKVVELYRGLVESGFYTKAQAISEMKTKRLWFGSSLGEGIEEDEGEPDEMKDLIDEPTSSEEELASTEPFESETPTGE